jgi:hypothetical protein
MDFRQLWFVKPTPTGLLRMVQDINLLAHITSFSAIDKMPVPQRVNFLVGWASYPPLKGLLRMAQDINLLTF